MRVMQLRRDVISWIFSEFAENDQEATEENSILAPSWNFLRGCNCSLQQQSIKFDVISHFFRAQIRN